MTLRIFEKGNFTKDKPCMICGGTNNEEKSVLIPIDGTEDGNVMECECVHLNCIDLRVSEENVYLYQILPRGKHKDSPKD